MTDLQHLRDFYVRSDTTLFDVWERGEAYGDSVTPSAYSPEYRRWMCGILTNLLAERPGGMISIGCGNAMVEALVARTGVPVLAVDALDEAVSLARAKGLDAVRADVRTWSPPPGEWTLVYADGLFGHLYEPGVGLRPVLTRVREWLVPTEGLLVISHDHTNDGSDAQPAPGVPGCSWLSAEYLRKQAAAAGFVEVSCAMFGYQRPLSGPRNRVVLTARAAE